MCALELGNHVNLTGYFCLFPVSPGAPPAPVTTVVGRLFSIFFIFQFLPPQSTGRWNLVPNGGTWFRPRMRL